MAIMIPDKPRECYAGSREEEMFHALKKLPDDYYVFHSVSITDTRNNVLRDSETDFIIFHRQKGLICIEAKAGQVSYEMGCWYYGDGGEMHSGGPFSQAKNGKYRLKDLIRDKNPQLAAKCRFYHAVWFPSYTDENINDMTLPPDADKKLILSLEALKDPAPYIERIYALGNTGKITGELGEKDFRFILREVLCPEFKIVPTAVNEANIKKITFNRLLAEQAGILDFLEEQATAAINGAAGTGKTMIALEKARRHAARGEDVLFLCFNALLREFLEINYADEHISFFTIAGFACDTCDTETADYRLTKEKLEEAFCDGTFRYKHVIIDEGQDFGRREIEEPGLMETLRDIVTGTGGSFYVFYDRLQMVQAREMPKFIGDLDCRVTLSKNCRNTENIAATSLSPLTEKKPKLIDGAVKGDKAKLYFCSDENDAKAKTDSIIDELFSAGFKDIAVLTCKTAETSILKDFAEEGKYRKCLFTTCRKFKGLEADAVVLIDVTKAALEGERALLFYVGSSRARIRLDIAAVLSDEDCLEVLTGLGRKEKPGKAKEALAEALNARAVTQQTVSP